MRPKLKLPVGQKQQSSRYPGFLVFCGLASVHASSVCRYSYRVFVFVFGSFLVTEWPFLTLIFHEIMAVLQQNTQAQPSG